jgi:hypothetical protein
MKKVLIATPFYNGQVHHGYLRSVLQVIMAGTGRGYNVAVYTLTDSLITRARNNAVATFLDGDWDYLFWIDADISFEPEQFFRILDAQRGVAAAGYPLKTFFTPVEPTNLVGRDLEASMLRYAVTLPDGEITVPEDGFIEVPEAATGFMCVHRPVLEQMTEAFPNLRYKSDQAGLGGPASPNHYLFFDTMVEGERYLSEDYAFCRRAQSIGVQIWLDLRSELTHTGSYDFRGSIPDTNRAAQMRSVPGEGEMTL